MWFPGIAYPPLWKTGRPASCRASLWKAISSDTASWLAEALQSLYPKFRMKHFFQNVPRLGNVAVSRHAQAQMEKAGITEQAFERALLQLVKPDKQTGYEILWRAMTSGSAS